MGQLAVVLRVFCVLFRSRMVAMGVVVVRHMVVMRRSVVVASSRMVVLGGRMVVRFCH